MTCTFFTRLQAYVPDLPHRLNGPAAPEAINHLEAVTGYHFPEAFKQFYAIYDGDKGLGGIYMGLEGLSIDNMRIHWNHNRLYSSNLQSDVISYESNKIKEVSFHPDWFPIAHDGGGNYLGMDFSPGAKGTYGQLINYGRDEQQLYVISESFESFLGYILCQYEKGRCTVQRDEFVGDTYIAWGNSGHFFDDLPEAIETPAPVVEIRAKSEKKTVVIEYAGVVISQNLC
ncbi:SMI1/KNR4 family protein [Paenibacillus sp. FSL H7-0331]|uniref:SMI1/KNR4 family protein n=1 Tax=Paenibacillus sp. FSL H7-0331 TaxID=1920421 RepID=UPI00096E74D9|nr:SMI1/KNR4 family protein [Paenibacillus sp. FSL H7-0331]OMF18740.1 hypothetical protein BK127_09845 [Paenibacillus sp. FSL H7-0331]